MFSIFFWAESCRVYAFSEISLVTFFIQRLQTFFYSCHVFTFLTFFYSFFERFLHLWFIPCPRHTSGHTSTVSLSAQRSCPHLRTCQFPYNMTPGCNSWNNVFYRAACNADAVLWWEFCLSVCPSVCLSVCPSVTRVYCDKTVDRSVQIFIPYERAFSLVFWEEEWLVGGDPFYLKFCVNRPPLERNRRFSTNNRS